MSCVSLTESQTQDEKVLILTKHEQMNEPVLFKSHMSVRLSWTQTLDRTRSEEKELKRQFTWALRPLEDREETSSDLKTKQKKLMNVQRLEMSSLSSTTLRSMLDTCRCGHV